MPKDNDRCAAGFELLLIQEDEKSVCPFGQTDFFVYKYIKTANNKEMRYCRWKC